MKKKILSVLLAVVMLASACSMMIVPVSAETTGTTYEVTDGASIQALIADTTKNTTANTMRLTQDLEYNAADLAKLASGTYGFWNGLMMDIDGNGHTITINGSDTESYAIPEGILLCFPPFPNNTWDISNLTVKSNGKITTTGETLSLFGYCSKPVQGVTFNIKNCCFDLDLKTTSTSENVGIAVLISRIWGNSSTTTMNIEDSYFNLDAERTTGRAGVLVARSNTNTYRLNVNIKNTSFDVTGVTGIVAQAFSNTTTFIVAENSNTFVNGTEYMVYDTISVVDAYKANKGIVETELPTGWTYTLNSVPVSTNLITKFPQHFLTEATADGAKVEFEGYQTTNLVDGKAKVRLVATLADDYNNYDEVGFEVVAVYEKDGVKTAKSQKVACTKVYSSISAVTGNEAYPESISASSLIGGEGYIFAMVITGVPEGISLQVRTYSVSGETTTYGATEVFTIADIPGGTVGGN